MLKKAVRTGLLFMLLAAVALAGLGAAPPTNQGGPPPKAAYAPDHILVAFKAGTPASAMASAHRESGGRPVEVIPGINVHVVSVPAGEVLARVAAYSRNPNVLFAEPDYIAYAIEAPVSDPYFDKQWGLNNTGQTGGIPDADIDAPEAWAVTVGSSDTKIAILDTGIDQDHEDLVGKIVTNINFTTSGTNDDLYGHGTHVAGIAAAATNNATTGVAGVGYNSSLMNVKVLGDNASGYYSWIANGIIWAADEGAKVINMSLGGGAKSQTLQNAVNYAWGKGVVLAAAAGNSGSASPTYPAYYSNCIAVAATNSNDLKASWSSFGKWVDVAAPGVDIYSTFPNHPYVINKGLGYGYGSGTSMATPHVAGAAALVWATSLTDANGNGRRNDEVRTKLETTADKISGTGKYWTYGRINAYNAVK